MNHLIETLKNPLLNLSELERRVNCPKRTILMAVNGDRPLPEKWVWGICVELARAGIPINGWTMIYDDATHSFTAAKKLNPDNLEVIEHEEQGGTWFEYRVSESRDIISDDIELQMFFE